jgi:hypothetical protein
MTKNVYENEVFRETVVTDNLLTGMSIGTLQADFLLCEADFLRLKGGSSAFVTWSLNVLFATIGYAMSILPKWISELAGKPEKVSQSEWTTFAIGLSISFILLLISKAMPNEKKELLNSISQHFKSAPKSRQLVRGQ